jgi:hypothetical protein
MSDPRILGLTLMAISSGAFLGTTSNTLPPVTFFPALALFALGAIRFLKSNHESLKRAEDKAHQDVNHAAAKPESTRAGAGTAPGRTTGIRAQSFGSRRKK